MNYETAKKLKEVGFIQRKWKYARHYIPDKNEMGEQMIVLYENYKGSGKDLVYIPSLEELIEACGDDIVLWHYSAGHNEKWCAGKIKECSDNYLDDYPEPRTRGKTPLEAVAKLWLKLNDKD